MGLAHSPRIVTDGLVLALDAANLKSYDKYENLLKYSNDFSQSEWTKQNSHPTPSKDAVGPDGAANSASTVYRTATNQYLHQQIVGGGTYTLSVWVKSEAATGSFLMQAYNATDGATGQVTHTATNEWQRFETTMSPTTTSTYYPCVPTNTNTNFYVWGAQVERGTTATDYYETTSTAKTRGTTWTDLSGNGYNFNVNASAYSTSGGISHMNFEGSYGAAKRVVSNSLTDVPNFSNATIMCFSTILNSTSTWRTLTRGSSRDHQVIIQNSNNNLGMYDNDGSGFIDSGFDITSLPNPYTQFNCLTWRLSQSSPYYQFQYNDNSTIYSITNANSTFNNGFSIIGAYHNNSTNVNTSAQYWGKISVFLYYSRQLTASEIQQNFNALRGRFGI